MARRRPRRCAVRAACNHKIGNLQQDGLQLAPATQVSGESVSVSAARRVSGAKRDSSRPGHTKENAAKRSAPSPRARRLACTPCDSTTPSTSNPALRTTHPATVAPSTCTPLRAMVAPIVPIGVMLGKADTAFKLVGGSSIVYNAIRSYIFGKVLRAIEYPDGDLHTVKIYRGSLYTLKSLIADTQPPPFPTAFLEPNDIKQVSVFTSPHFTEPIRNDSDVSALSENSWLFWSKETFEELPIPTRSVKLDGSHVLSKPKPREDPTLLDTQLQDNAISLASKIRRSQQFSRWQYDRIVDLAVDRDAGLMTIARNFSGKDDEFRTHCVRLLNRRDPRSILVSDGGQALSASDLTDSESSADENEKRNLDPQVELSSRE